MRRNGDGNKEGGVNGGILGNKMLLIMVCDLIEVIVIWKKRGEDVELVGGMLWEGWIVVFDLVI